VKLKENIITRERRMGTWGKKGGGKRGRKGRAEKCCKVADYAC